MKIIPKLVYLPLVGGILFFLLFFFHGFNITPASAQTPSPDAIAIRVFPNTSHHSALRWYRDKGFIGSPQSLTVDGYEAVRDGQTVYVNAGNVDLGQSPRYLYTNIYVITYNQDAESATRDIFAQVLAHWSFNANFTAGETWSGADAFCSGDASTRCQTDRDCADKGYCQSAKAQVTRDTIRLARLYDIEALVLAYAEKHGRYPALEAGTYLKNATLSVWPSWQAVLAQDLGAALPVDPINSLDKTGDCAPDRFHPVTCWDERAKEFAWTSDLRNADLPDNNFVFLYSYVPADSAGYTLCAYSETGMFEDMDKMCNEGGCVPSCYGKECGSDGCGGSCGACGAGETCENDRCFSGCATGPGCRSGLTHAHTVAGLCGAGLCYECDDGYHWVDPNCVCTRTCNAPGQPNCLTTAPAGATAGGGACCTPGEVCYQCPSGTSWNGVSCSSGCAPTCNAPGQPNCRTTAPADTSVVFGPTCCNTGEVCYQCRPGYAWDSALNACRCAPVSIEPVLDAQIYAVPPVSPPYYHGPTLYSAFAQASGGLGFTYSLSANPAWLAISSATGQMQGSHTAPGTFSNITVTARNDCGRSASDSFNLSVLPNEWCGDGRIQGAYGETCETTSVGAGTGFDDQWRCIDCRWAGGYCGDGTIQPEFGEVCDDGNTSSGDACSSTCRPTYCGDGVRQTPNTAGFNEACDDGEDNGDVCVADYGTSCNYCTDTCTQATVTGAFCGDGLINGTEQCDGNSLGGATCVSLGFGSGVLSCSACAFNTSNCCMPYTCVDLGKNCDSWPNGCGGTVNCGSCGVNSACQSGVCACLPGYEDYNNDGNCEICEWQSCDCTPNGCCGGCTGTENKVCIDALTGASVVADSRPCGIGAVMCTPVMQFCTGEPDCLCVNEAWVGGP